MQFDMQALPPADRYKLLTGVVVPRPIAWVTTLNADGSVNAAPYSFFNVLGSDPPVVAIGVGDRERFKPKDTAANIRRTREFVVNVVTADLADAMNVTAADFPVGESEFTAAGLTPAPSVRVAAPGIAQSPVQLECHEVMTLEIGRTRVVLGEVVYLHIDDELMLDPLRLYVNTPKLNALGRMGGRGGYVRATDVFELPRLTFEQWLAGEDLTKRDS